MPQLNGTLGEHFVFHSLAHLAHFRATEPSSQSRSTDPQVKRKRVRPTSVAGAETTGHAQSCSNAVSWDEPTGSSQPVQTTVGLYVPNTLTL